MEKAKRVADLLGVETLLVKRICGLPLKDVYVYSVEDGVKKYQEAEDEEERFAVLQKWLSLCQNHEQANEAWKETQTTEEEVLAIETRLALVQAFDEISDLLDYETEDEALKSKIIKVACSLNPEPEKITELYNNTEKYSNDEKMIIEAWVKVSVIAGDCSSINEEMSLEDFFSVSDEDISAYDEDELKDYEQKKSVVLMLENAAQTAISQAFDFDGTLKISGLLIPGSSLEKTYLSKLISLCRWEDHLTKVKSELDDRDDDDETSKELLAELIKKAYEIM